MRLRFAVVFCGVALGMVWPASGQTSAAWDDPGLKWATHLAYQYRIYPDLVYKRASGVDLKLDVYKPSGHSTGPVLMYIHGGGWIGLSKEITSLTVQPYLAMGFRVVNVEYRMADTALAPAAVEDCRCALRWIRENADEYGFDTTRIVVSGHSAGGHLALMTGMIDRKAGFDYECPFSEIPAVAAIVNFFGVVDVADLLPGAENEQFYAVRWFGGLPDAENLARRVSPITYVRQGVPPVLTVHGDEDTLVPYSHAVRLHEALDRVGVKNRLITVEGKGHGNFEPQRHFEIQMAIRAFLIELGVLSDKREKANPTNRGG